MTDTTPFKLRVLHAVTDALKEITPANGYESDLADFTDADDLTLSRVYRGRAWFGDHDPIPMISVLEATDEADPLFADPADHGGSGYDWSLIVQGFVNDDRENPTDPAYRLLRDVRRRLAKEKERKAPGRHVPDPLGTRALGIPGCQVTQLRISPGRVRPADDISAKAYFTLVLTLTITENALEA